MKPRALAEPGDGVASFSTGGVDVGQREKHKMKWQEIWEDSKGMLLILCSELFGTSMAAVARLLEMGDAGMMTLQVSIATNEFGRTILTEKYVDHVCALYHNLCIELFILLVHENARFPFWETRNQVAACTERHWRHRGGVWFLL
jgi:hypothetical protein